MNTIIAKVADEIASVAYEPYRTFMGDKFAWETLEPNVRESYAKMARAAIRATLEHLRENYGPQMIESALVAADDFLTWDEDETGAFVDGGDVVLVATTSFRAMLSQALSELDA